MSNGAVYRTFDHESRAKRFCWAIQCSAHIAVRIQRVFGRITRQGRGVLQIGDTVETCRDLIWFLDRYPMEIAEDDRLYLLERARTHVETARDIAAILAKAPAAKAFELAVPAREYQKQAAALLLRTGRLLLADDLGLGKTASAICALTDARTRPALVVTLTHLPTQWAAEIAKFAPQLRVHCIKKAQPYDLCRPPRIRRRDPEERFDRIPDVIVTNYAKLSAWQEIFAQFVKMVVYDEAQELRLQDSNKYRAARAISDAAVLRMALTATPVYNYGDEIFSVIDCIAPEALGTHAEFVREHCTSHGRHDIVTDPKAFGSFMRAEGLMLRRTRKEVGRELPALTKVIHAIDTEDDAFAEVAGDCAALARALLVEGGRGFDKMRAGGELDYKLRLATGLAKAPFVAQFVKLLLESEEKIVLFGWHHRVYDLWMKELEAFNPVLYTGEQSPAQKNAAKERFATGDARVFIMSLRAGAGLDGLQHCCRTGVFGELDWSPQVHAQNGGRIHRDGQKEPVVLYYMLANDGSDPVIVDVLGLKRSQSEPMVDPDAEIVEASNVDPEKIKRLAEEYLRQRGLRP